MSIAVLKGAGFLLRGWQEADAAPFAALNADREVMEHFPAPLTRAESDALIERAQAGLEERGWGLWCLDVGGACVGFVGLAVPGFEAHFTPCVEIGWRLTRAAWGHGYATAAARLALAHGFDVVGLSEIVSFTATSNVRSQRVMQRLGMTHDPAEDFDHPRLAPGNPLRRHVLYRLRRPV